MAPWPPAGERERECTAFPKGKPCEEVLGGSSRLPPTSPETRPGPPGHSPAMTVSSGGSWPTNSSPRSSKAPNRRLQARTASWISSGSSDCGERPASGSPAGHGGPTHVPTGAPAPSDRSLDPGGTLRPTSAEPPTGPSGPGAPRDERRPPGETLGPASQRLSPSEPGLPRGARLSASDPRSLRPPHLQHRQDVEHGVGLRAARQHRLQQAAQRPARAPGAADALHAAAAPRGRSPDSRAAFRRSPDVTARASASALHTGPRPAPCRRSTYERLGRRPRP